MFYHNNLVILNFEFLRFKILEFAHDIMIAEHSDCVKIYKIVQQVYYWFMMHDFVWKYVQFCSTCVQEKNWHAKKQDVLQFLFIFMWQWQDILIDFIINLSNNNDYTNVMIVINQLIKMRYMIFLKLLDIIEIAEVFIQNIFKLYELSDMIIFNHEDQFIAIFWKILCTWLEIEVWFLTIFHSETDDQMKNTNIIIKQYLWMYYSYLQNDWKKWLFLVKFITNNTMNESTNVILFYVTYRQNSWIEFES